MNSYDNNSDTKPRLYRKIIVITGASSGVGCAAALAFARRGAHLVLAARRENALAEVVKECEELGGKAIAVKTDVTDAAAMQQLAKTAAGLGNGIDVWINNAGVLAAGEFTETPVDVHDQVIRVNLMGYLHGAYAVLPYFKQQGYGILINNISVGGWFPVPYAVGYSASKFGLRGFSEALRGELYAYPQIRVCDLFPGFLDTPGIQHAANYTGRELQPAPPVLDPQRVARAMVFLAEHPRSSKTVGIMASFLRLAYAVLPTLTRRITAGVTESYLRNAKPIAITSGNLFEPVDYGTSIHGAWNSSTDTERRKKKLTNALLIAGVAVGFFLIRRKVID